MKWKVENALSRDVERQHLNKILRDIEAALSTQQGSANTLTEARVREIIRESTPAPLRPTSYRLELTGDVTGTAVLTAGLNQLNTDIALDVIEDAPTDGIAYWRKDGEWQAAGGTATVVGPGIITADEFGQWYARVLQGVEGEIVVSNADGAAGDPLVGLADVENTGEGDGGVRVYTRDEKGRIEGDRDATTDDLPEGDNLYFTEERVQDTVVQLLQNSDDIHFEFDESVPAVYANLSNEVWDAISNVVNVVGTPTDADIMEYDETVSGWVPKKNPRELLLDGGNF